MAKNKKKKTKNNGKHSLIKACGKKTLKDFLDFPTEYEFKIMGKTENLVITEIVKKIEDIIKKHINEENIRKKESSAGKYTSYSVKVSLDTYEQLEEIYKTLKAQKEVIYYL